MSRRIFLSTNCHFVENYVFNYCEQMMKHVIKTAQEILRSFFRLILYQQFSCRN